MRFNLRISLQAFRIEWAIVGWLVLAGVALRLRQYLAGRSLWLDESMLALNIVGRDFWGLLQPLDYNQGGPVGFLLAEKLIVTLLGNHELSLRLLPFLTGCASLLLFALLLCPACLACASPAPNAGRCRAGRAKGPLWAGGRQAKEPVEELRHGLGKAGAFTALALFAAGAPAIYYASEVKQYSSDVFIALLLFWLASQNLNHQVHQGAQSFRGVPSSSFVFLRDLRGEKIFLTLAGALAIWCSHPALFVLASIGATLLLDGAIRKDIRQLKTALAMIVLWAASFATLYFASLRGLAANPFLRGYWNAYFMPMPPWADLAWFPATLQSSLENPVGLGLWTPLPAAFMAIGLISLLRHRPRFGAMLALALLATLAASGLGMYPIAGRMILFAAPILLALLGAGVETVTGWIRVGWLRNATVLALAGLLLYQPLATAAQNFITPKYPEHIRPAMAYLRENYRPGDALYVYYWAVPAFRYYAPFYDFSQTGFIAGQDHSANPLTLLEEIDQLRGQERVWVLFSHVYEAGDYNEKDAVLAHLDEIGVKRREFRQPGTSVYLYLYNLDRR